MLRPVKKPKPKLVPIEQGDFPPDPKPLGVLASKFATGTPVDVIGDVALGVKPNSLAQETLLFVGTKPVKLPTGFYVALAVGDDRCAVIDQQKGDIFEIDRTTAKPTRVCSMPAIVPQASAWLGDRLAILEHGGVHLLERTGKGMTPVQKLAVEGITIASVGERLVVAGSKKIHVLDMEDGELTIAAKLTSKAPIVIAHEAQFLLTDHRFETKRTGWWKLES